jgi:hypothetical protein
MGKLVGEWGIRRLTPEEIESLAERAMMFVEDEVNNMGGDIISTELVFHFMASGDHELPEEVMGEIERRCSEEDHGCDPGAPGAEG